MYRIFAVIRKKKNVGRTAALFFGLVLIELFSHALLDHHHSFGESALLTTDAAVSIESGSRLNESLVIESGEPSGNTDQSFLNDQTLHHDVLIAACFFPAKKTTYQNERIVFYSDGLIDTPVSPPYLPPQTF